MTTEALTINVDRTEVAARGQRNNRPWVKYQVFGTRADGSRIVDDGLPIFTFDKLGKGEVEVTLDEFTKSNGAFRESWTVKRVKQDRPKAARPAGGADPDQLADLEDRVSTLEGQVARLLAANRKTGVSV